MGLRPTTTMFPRLGTSVKAPPSAPAIMSTTLKSMPVICIRSTKASSRMRAVWGMPAWASVPDDLPHPYTMPGSMPN